MLRAHADFLFALALVWAVVSVRASIVTTSLSPSSCSSFSTLVWGTDHVLSYNPTTFGDLTKVQQVTDFSAAQVEALRLQALAWFSSQFGVDTSNTFYAPPYTIVPGVGSVVPVAFDTDYNLLTFSAANHFGLCSLVPRLVVVTFTLIFDQATTFCYGGAYGAWADAQCAFVPNCAAPTQFLNYGVYVVKIDAVNYTEVVGVMSKEPSESNTLGTVIEYSLLEVPYNGTSPVTGEAYVRSTNYATNTTAPEYVSKIRSMWSFPEGFDLFQHTPASPTCQ